MVLLSSHDAVKPEQVQGYCQGWWWESEWRIEDVAKVMNSLYVKGDTDYALVRGGDVKRISEYTYSRAETCASGKEMEELEEKLQVAYEKANNEEEVELHGRTCEYSFQFFGVLSYSYTPEAMIEHFKQMGVDLYYSESKKEFFRVEDMHLEHVRNVVFNKLEETIVAKSVIDLMEIIESPLYQRLTNAWKYNS
jgi:hypothetical protein